jgi:hypothetical protein
MIESDDSEKAGNERLAFHLFLKVKMKGTSGFYPYRWLSPKKSIVSGLEPIIYVPK